MNIFLSFMIPLLSLWPWESIGPEGGEVSAVLQSSQNTDILYAYSGDFPSQVIKSIDGGSTWTVISYFDNGTPYDMVMTASGKLVAVGFNRVWVSDDDGVTWGSSYYMNTIFNDAVAHPVNGDEIFAIGSKAIGSWNMTFFHSTDGGVVWDEFELISSTNHSYGDCIDISPSNPDIILVGGEEIGPSSYIPFLFLSTDGGAFFSDVTPPAAFYENAISGVGIHPTHPDTMLASTYSGVYRTLDGAANWTKMQDQPYSYDISFSEINTDLVLSTSSWHIHRSSDCGASWSTSSAGLTGSNIYWVVPDAVNSSIAYTGSNTGFFHSSDGGITWSLQNSGLLAGRIIAMEYVNGYIFMSMKNMGLFRSEEGPSAMWETISVPASFQDMCDIESNGGDTLLALEGTCFGSAELFRSTDGGSVWTSIDNYYENGYDLVHGAGNTFWCCGYRYEYPYFNGVVSLTVDAGTSWTRYELFSSSQLGYIEALAVDPSDPDRVFCMGYFNSNYIIYYTENGGGSWQTQPTTDYPGITNGLAICPTDGNKLAAASAHGLYASDDGGANWYQVTTDFEGVNDVRNSNILGGLLAATEDEEIWLWENWTGTPTTIGDLGYPAVQCIEEGIDYLYAGTAGYAVWRKDVSQSIEEGATPAMDITISVSPNPSNGFCASVTFTLPAQQQAALSIYDITGRKLATPMQGIMNKGTNQINLDTSTLTQGMYFVRLETEQTATTARIIVIR